VGASEKSPVFMTHIISHLLPSKHWDDATNAIFVLCVVSSTVDVSYTSLNKNRFFLMLSICRVSELFVAKPCLRGNFISKELGAMLTSQTMTHSTVCALVVVLFWSRKLFSGLGRPHGLRPNSTS
jgi:hypothetical protein